MRIEMTPEVVYDADFFTAWYCATYYRDQMALYCDPLSHVKIAPDMFCMSSVWNDACEVSKRVLGTDFPVWIHKDTEDPILQKFFEDYPELDEITFVFND